MKYLFSDRKLKRSPANDFEFESRRFLPKLFKTFKPFKQYQPFKPNRLSIETMIGLKQLLEKSNGK